MPKTPSTIEKNKKLPSWASDSLRAFSSLNVVVLGDVMLDRYWFGEVPRISPEAPVPVFLKKSGKDDQRLGGAANTWANLLSLGARAKLVGVVGQDEAGAQVEKIMEESGGDSESLFFSSHRPTSVKTRLVAMTQQVLRLDEESLRPLERAELNHLKQKLDEATENCDAVVVSDYAKGVLNPSVADYLGKISKKKGLPVLVDPKPQNMPLFKGFTLLSPNVKEASQMSGILYGGTWEEKLIQVQEMADIIFKRYKPEHLVITLGGDGMAWCHPSHKPLHQAAQAREVFDVSGAGDTVHATLALGLALQEKLGLSKIQLLELANRAAAVAVSRVGTVRVTAQEVAQTWV